MARSFTVYWAPKGWPGLIEGVPIPVAGGSGFIGRITVGDRVYVTNIKNGTLRLLGAFRVQAIQTQKPKDAVGDYDEYLLADIGSSSPLRIRAVPTEMARRLRFKSDKRPHLVVDATGKVDGQTLRAVRELVSESAELLESLLGEGEPASPDSSTRLPIDVLNKATADYVWAAVQLLSDGAVSHSFGESTDYDLIADDGQRLAPKAVFGVALSRAIGSPVLPKHFTAGLGSPCFRLLGEAGYEIVPKGQASQESDSEPGDPGEGSWDEGRKRLVSHLKRERKRGLSLAKKADFRRRNEGRLFCEHCSMDPVAQYGTEHAESCIEVHHAATQVHEMGDGHQTALNDLECLCANCHRLEHRLLRLGLGGQSKFPP